MEAKKCDLDPRMFRLAVDHLNPFALLDEDGKYIYVNKAWEEIRGKTFADVAGHFVEEIFPDTSARRAMLERRPIVAHPVISGLDNQKHFTTYTPLYKDGKMIGCAIQTIFSGFSEALEFSWTFTQMQNERNFYKQELRRLRGAKYSIDNIIGDCPKVQEMKRQIRQAARSHSNVLLVGETGTGKELVAHSLHDLSARGADPFVKINCAAIPQELAESELFGYEYGAFTGAKKGGKPGKFETANNGSLFLDEINHMSLVVQPKLLRVLQEQEIERVGGNKSIPVDVRLITATNVPLEQLVEEKTFRRDLYYRLNVIQIQLPPLRERLEDVAVLAENIIEKLNGQLGMQVDGISADAIRHLQDYSWPGNIRELQNVLERGMNSRMRGTLLWSDFADSFPERLFRLKLDEGNASGTYRNVRKKAEQAMIAEVLESCGGNKKRAAEQLGISRTLLYRKLKQLETGG